MLIVLASVPAAWAMGLAAVNENTDLPSPQSTAPATLHWPPASPSSVPLGISRAALHTGTQKDDKSYFDMLPGGDKRLDDNGAPLRGDRFHWQQP
ncbi:hypothetical protein [Paraburkholderia silvatlantica]|uniref:Uncharacterized protein n=1 Tax=Paraburkholderia silvatlantica TaxID=321895 RepID=A0ABR6FHD5_9BURK|nr:hypothetical protein [Paraburkholderia silvatlantica]MBB2926838.1 hypothetical protein [Paraburkholderia silvatlantica]